MCIPRRNCHRNVWVRRQVCTTRKNGPRVCRKIRRKVRAKAYRCIPRRHIPPTTIPTIFPTGLPSVCPNVCFRWWKQARDRCNRRMCHLKRCPGSTARQGWVCASRFTTFPTPYFTPVPSIPVVPTVPPTACPNVCFRWWKQARAQCNRLVCDLKRCSGRKGWVCASRAPVFPIPSPIFPSPSTVPPPPSASVSSSPGPHTCFGGCKPLLQARTGCDGRFCVNKLCFNSGGVRLYSCVPKQQVIVSISPSPSATILYSPTVSASSSPGPQTCFGGCKPLLQARIGCDGRFCVNELCFNSGGVQLYSCVPKRLATITPSHSTTVTPTSTTTVTSTPSSSVISSPSPQNPNPGAFCASVCVIEKTEAEVKATCDATRCVVVRCIVKGSTGTGYGCVSTAVFMSPSPSTTASGATVRIAEEQERMEGSGFASFTS